MVPEEGSGAYCLESQAGSTITDYAGKIGISWSSESLPTA